MELLEKKDPIRSRRPPSVVAPTPAAEPEKSQSRMSKSKTSKGD